MTEKINRKTGYVGFTAEAKAAAEFRKIEARFTAPKGMTGEERQAERLKNSTRQKRNERKRLKREAREAQSGS